MRDGPVRLLIAADFLAESGYKIQDVIHPKWVVTNRKYLKYRTVKAAMERMLARGLVEKFNLDEIFGDYRSGAPGPEPRIAYKLTDAGRIEMRRWLDEWEANS